MYKIGMRVQAIMVVTEGGGKTKPDYKATNLIDNPGFVHALPGDYGTVEYVDDNGVPTVRFDETGTATIVGDNEVSIV